MIRGDAVVYVTTGGDENLPGGRFTVNWLFPGLPVPPSGPPATVPAAMGKPVMDPSAPNVSGPQCPDPSPLTTNVLFVDFSVAGAAFGNEFVVGGVNTAIPTGTGETVTSAGTTDRDQLLPPAAREYKRFCKPARTGKETVTVSRAPTSIVATGDAVVSCVPSYQVKHISLV